MWSDQRSECFQVSLLNEQETNYILMEIGKEEQEKNLKVGKYENHEFQKVGEFTYLRVIVILEKEYDGKKTTEFMILSTPVKS